MSKFSKALEIIGIGAKEQRDNYVDDYFEDDYNDEHTEKPISNERTRRYPKRDVIDDYENETQSANTHIASSTDAYASRQSKAKLAAIRGGVNISKTMVIHTPKSYQESQSLVMQLKQNKQIIIKLDSVEKEVAQRILDFMSGAVFALECQVVKISKGIYLFASNDMLVEREEQEQEQESADNDTFYSSDEIRRR